MAANPLPTRALRWTSILVTLALSLGAGVYVLGFTGADGINLLDLVRAALVVVTSFWLVWGAVPAVIGILVRRPKPQETDARPTGSTVILMPIYNEEPDVTFSRIAAMNRGLVRMGLGHVFHIAILSDSNNLAVAAREAVAFERLMREPEARGRIFYRRREINTAKKAGNIEDFVTRSGGAYDYAIVLDADSLMEPATMAAMAARMDREPDLGLIQTVPRIIRAQTLFGRTIQFAAAYLSPAIARGAAVLQGREGPYWGHNAIMRMSAFAASCGLPVLSGKPPHGGHILSHDYVEAALLSRAGWRVEVDISLRGSYEEGPENLIEFAKRDRRWCQGNLQHRRLLLAPRLRAWSRMTLLQGIMAYLASPLWLALLAASIIGAAAPIPVAMANPGLPNSSGSALALGVAALLVLPKLLIVLRGMLDGENRRFGGTLRVVGGMTAEIVFSTLLAPVLLMLQCRAVFQCLLGLDGGWPATRRDCSRLPLATAFAATWWIVATGALTFVAVCFFAMGTLLWVLPVTIPAILAPVLVWASSLPGRGAGVPWLLATETERQPSPVMVEQQDILASWHRPRETSVTRPDAVEVSLDAAIA